MAKSVSLAYRRHSKTKPLMDKFVAYIKLVRPINLVVIVLTMVFFRKFIIMPFFEATDAVMVLDAIYFDLLIVAVLLITAAGYIVNDYFDIDTDEINKPDKVILGKVLDKEFALNVHFALALLGIGLAFFVGWQIDRYELGYIFILCAVILWFYAKSLKKMPLVGNIIVALLSGLVLIVTVVYHRSIFNVATGDEALYGHYILTMMLAYSLFAFLVSFIREIVKDLEDIRGDRRSGMETMPVAWGEKVTKGIAILIALVLTGALGFCANLYLKDKDTLKILYIGIGLIIPIFAGIYFLLNAAEKAHYSRLSLGLKIIMLIGICSIPIFYFTS